MSRWRAPVKRSSPYITGAGYRALEAETETLWKRRREVVKHLAAAAAEGDRSENAEYIYRKKEIGDIDRRIRYLQRRMPELNVISATQGDPDQVFFGASVTVEDESGSTFTYRIVGSDETDGSHGWISVDPTWDEDLVDASHIQMSEDSDDLKWTNVLGKMKFQALEVKN